MTQPKIEERTLYHPLISYLKSIGFGAIGESTVLKKHPDIYFKVDSVSFVIEVKIGTPDIGLKAVAQAADYAKRLGTQNIIVLIYPEKYRNQTILFLEKIDEIALRTKLQALVLTEFWTESLQLNAAELFDKLKIRFLQKKIKIDFRTIVNLIENFVTDLNSIVYQIKTDKLIAEVVNKLDLFTSIGELKDKETAKKQVINMASYLLFNQLLFYHILAKKLRKNTGDDSEKKLCELSEIKTKKDIQGYFNTITDIDYQSIYRINILGHIPEKPEVIDILNKIIKSIKLLRAEHITHDLAGRFFHDLIPFEVRKILAAFYTHPVAAEILAALTIDSWDEEVIDPACGSGTLLVAAYKRKKSLYTSLYGFRNIENLHRTFIEKDITGIDIMPFAAHITTINLTTQNIEQETNVVRIATKDSLSLSGVLKKEMFKKTGVRISPYTKTIQDTLFRISEPKVSDSGGAISPKGVGKEFKLKPVDSIIMNPPFSDREKMPTDMRQKIKDNHVLGEICGHRINLWGYFLALSDLLLKPNGKIGVVVPINIARGKATEKIREYLLENYCIKYIIKPVGDLAFSEGSAFRDILLIAEKRKPKAEEEVRIVFLKQSIREINLDDADKVVAQIKDISSANGSHTSKDLDISFESQGELWRMKENLMPLVGVSEIASLKAFAAFFKILKIRGKDKIKTLEGYKIREGFHASPAGLSQLTFITRSIGKQRLERAFMILDDDKTDYVRVILKNTDRKYKIRKTNLLPALRTLTNMKNFNFDNKKDYFITKPFKDFESLLMLSKWEKKQPFNWSLIDKKLKNKLTYLAVARRFRPDSRRTHFFAFYSDKKFVVPHTFKIIELDKNESKHQCLYLNSIIGLFNIISLREQTTEGYTDIMESDLNCFYTIDSKKLHKKEIESLDRLFDKLKHVEFPSILEQVEDRFWARVELDETILKILGLSGKEINDHLPRIYNAITKELKAFIKIGSRKVRQEEML